MKFSQHKYIKFRSLKNYTVVLFCELLRNINFPKYSTEYTNLNNAYTDIVGKVMYVINKVAPIKEIRIKGNTQPWFDGKYLRK